MLPLKTLLRLQPEARLALAVLEDAAETLRDTHGVETSRAQRLAAHTWLWVENDEAHHTFALVFPWRSIRPSRCSMSRGRQGKSRWCSAPEPPRVRRRLD